MRPAEDEGVRYATDALDEAVAITGGYPYFLQELGYAVWTVADGPVITHDDVTTAVPGYQAKLDESFFGVPLEIQAVRDVREALDLDGDRRATG